MKAQVLPPSPPAGLHRMRLIGNEEVDGKWDKRALRWLFAVEGGEHDGKQIARTTATEIKLNESLGEFISELLGKELMVGSTVDLDEPIGKLFDVLVVQGTGNGVVIRKVTPVAE
ncbi:MAG: hypothetical protein KDD69_19855 [Bdellovibrionales bacterium]|nr:hypothetical protein [Bdellovibrionales bacterium]